MGRSNATDSAVWPWLSRYRKRALVSSAEPNPAYWRMVHSRSRYMDSYGPRTYGGSPGWPMVGPGSSGGPYQGSTGIPESVVIIAGRRPGPRGSRAMTPATTSSIGVPTPKTARTPRPVRAATSWGGIVPPTTSGMSSAPAARCASRICRASGMCTPDRTEMPITSASSAWAAATIWPGVWRSPR